VNRLNKWFKQAIMYLSLFAVFSFTVGCSLFGGLDAPQKTTATFINAFFAKSKTPTAEVRYQKMASVVSTNYKDSPTKPEYKTVIIQLIGKFMQDGINKDYYVADHPTESQTDTRRSVVIRFPKDSFSGATSIFGVDSSSANKESYGSIILGKEGDNWKITDVKNTDEKTLQKAKIDWKKVSPTDYLK
jgi:hypothetical protein